MNCGLNGDGQLFLCESELVKALDEIVNLFSDDVKIIFDLTFSLYIWRSGVFFGSDDLLQL